MKEKNTLRPVELYFLLCFAKHEKWNMTDALTAVLAELYERNLIITNSADPQDFVVNYIDASREGLRPYEHAALDAVHYEGSELLHDSIDDFRFKHFLLKNGVLTKERRYALFFPYQITVLSPDGKELVAELIDVQQQLTQEKNCGLQTVFAYLSCNYSDALLSFFNSYASRASIAAIKRHANYSLELSPMHSILL